MRRLGALMVLLLVVSACGDGGSTGTVSTTTAATTSSLASTTTVPTTTRPVRPSTTTTTAPDTAPVGGTVALPIYPPEGSPFSFSPWAPGFDPAVGELYLSGAWELDPVTLDLVPDLVVEIPTAANGGVVVHPDGTMDVGYRIRPEALWEDGTPVSGDDFAFTYEAITGLGLPDPEASLYAEIIPESVRVGEKTFSFTLPRTTIDYERLFAVVLPQRSVEGTDLLAAWGTRPWQSAGPFRFQGWAEAPAAPGEVGSIALFTRNNAYWRTDAAGQALPYLDGVEFHFVDGPRQAVAGFAGREFDAIDLGGWADVVSRLASLDGASVAAGDDLSWEHLAFQFGPADRNQASLNGSPIFRRAVAHAIDREAITGLASWVNGGTLNSFLDLTPAPGGEGWDRYAYDPALAAALLEDACASLHRDCTADPPVVIVSTTAGDDMRPEAARLAADMLDAIGIDARLAVEEASLFFGRTFRRGDWDVGMWAWEATGGLSGVVRTLANWDPAGPPPTGANYQRWGTPAVSGYGEEFDQGPSIVSDTATARYAAIISEMQTTVDRSRLLDLAAAAEEILADQVVLIPLATRGAALAWWSDSLAGVSRHPARPGTWNVERWYRLGA